MNSATVVKMAAAAVVVLLCSVSSRSAAVTTTILCYSGSIAGKSTPLLFEPLSSQLQIASAQLADREWRLAGALVVLPVRNSTVAPLTLHYLFYVHSKHFYGRPTSVASDAN